MNRAIDITGEKFGRLLAVRSTSQRCQGQVIWNCICDCGKETKAHLGNLRAGHTKSCGCLNKFPPGQAMANAVLAQYKKEARNRNVPWFLTEEEASILFGENCFYCGISPTNVKRAKTGNGPFTYSGIDRVDNTGPYERKNCVSCCIVCNRAKQTLSLEEFRLWVQRVYVNFGKRSD